MISTLRSMLGSKRKFTGKARISGAFGAAGCVYQVVFLAVAEPWVPILISPGSGDGLRVGRVLAEDLRLVFRGLASMGCERKRVQ